MTDVVGNPEEERRAEFYFQPWAQEAVCRYFYSKVSVPEQGSLSIPCVSEDPALLAAGERGSAQFHLRTLLMPLVPWNRIIETFRLEKTFKIVQSQSRLCHLGESAGLLHSVC